MSATAPSSRFSTQSVGLTRRDLEPVQFLVQQASFEEFEVPENLRLLVASITWLNAFTQFKYQRRKHGLPEGKADTYMYGAVLGQLKVAGKALAAEVLNGKLGDLKLPVSQENFVACIKELQCDDVLLDMGLLSPDKNLNDIAEIFADPVAT